MELLPTLGYEISLRTGKKAVLQSFCQMGELMPVYDAAMKYKELKKNLIVIAGKEYGTGSSRDWAAKGTALLGVKGCTCRKF